MGFCSIILAWTSSAMTIAAFMDMKLKLLRSTRSLVGALSMRQRRLSLPWSLTSLMNLIIMMGPSVTRTRRQMQSTSSLMMKHWCIWIWWLQLAWWHHNSHSWINWSVCWWSYWFGGHQWSYSSNVHQHPQPLRAAEWSSLAWVLHILQATTQWHWQWQESKRTNSHTHSCVHRPVAPGHCWVGDGQWSALLCLPQRLHCSTLWSM